MAKIKKVELNIGPAIMGGSTVLYKVSVRLTLDFAPTEDGKKFKYRIHLYDDNKGPFIATSAPIYRFKFDNSTSRVVMADFPFMQFIYKEVAFVPDTTLDVKKAIAGQPPQKDAIRAGALLYRGGSGVFSELLDFKTSNKQEIFAEQFA